MINNTFFQEHQNTLLKLLNSPIGRFVRRGLWIPHTRNPIIKLTPTSYHVLLPNGQIKATFYSNKQYQEALHKNYSWIWERIHAWDMRFANRFMPAWNMGFDTYSSQPDDTTGIDCYLSTFNPTTNNNNNVLYMGELNSGAYVTTLLIKFDFSSIPSGATSSAASLQLTITQDLSTNAPTMVFKHSLRAWSETQATWNVYTTGNNWDTAGARNASTDYGAQLASLTLGTADTGAKTWTFSTTEMDKYFNGTYTNNGWIGFSTVDNNDGYQFASSGNATSESRPKFDVTYSTSTNTMNFQPCMIID